MLFRSAADIRDKINLKHPRIVGRRDGIVKKMSIQLGARGSTPYFEMLENDVDLALCGEFCEWSDAEPIRDMAQIGMQKTVIVLGHAGSEKDAMEETPTASPSRPSIKLTAFVIATIQKIVIGMPHPPRFK